MVKTHKYDLLSIFRGNDVLPSFQVYALAKRILKDRVVAVLERCFGARKQVSTEAGFSRSRIAVWIGFFYVRFKRRPCQLAGPNSLGQSLIQDHTW